MESQNGKDTRYVKVPDGGDVALIFGSRDVFIKMIEETFGVTGAVAPTAGGGDGALIAISGQDPGKVASAAEAVGILSGIVGKKGELTAVLKGMKDVAAEDRPKV